MAVYFQPWDLHQKDMSDYLSGNIFDVMITTYDPFWLDVDENKASGEEITYTNQNEGYNQQGYHVANKTLTPGIPTINLSDYCAMPLPESRFIAKTSGDIQRATGVMADGEGRIGMFLNGYDTPSDIEPNGNYRGYGPNIHVHKYEYSGPIFDLSKPSQCLHMACRVKFGKMWFGAPAGLQPGVGGQLGWRTTFRRLDLQPFRQGLEEIVLVLGFWDSRKIGEPGFDGNDSVGNVTAGEQWVSGTLASGKTSQFVTNFASPQLDGLQPEGKEVDFYWNVSRQNMVNILNAFNVPNCTPEDVQINSTSFNCEMYDNRSNVAEFKEGQFGFNFSNMIVDIW